MKMDREGWVQAAALITIVQDRLVNRAFVLSASAHSRSWGHDNVDGHIPAVRETVLHLCLRADFELAFDLGVAVNQEFHYFSFLTLRDFQ
jgi:hypothetical protein